jgi:type II secretory pathway pseudopilin PulG
MIKNLRKRTDGFTVIEILIAVFLAGVVTTAAMALYITQHKQLTVQEEVSDMQFSVRAAMEELTSKVRMIGYRLPEGLPAIIARDSNPDTLKILFDTNELDDLQIEHPMPTPSAELRLDGHDLSAVHVGDTLYIYDPFTMSGEFFVVTEVQNSDHIQHNTTPLSRCYPRGSKVLKIRSMTYYIDLTDPNHPNMMYQYHDQPSQIYAENITDLNFQYILSSGAVVDVPAMQNMVREVLITVAGRTNKPDNDFHTPYRARTLSNRVKVRNLGVN